MVHSPGGGSAPGGVHGLGGVCSWGMHGPEVVCSGGCMVLGGCMVPGGVCLVETPPTATAAGGTHPTGMYSYHK